ncbi:MAG: DUF1592 domain-containing protein, partial [Lentisphaeraceae bacterium]|nr:DUF1592 domain-containing protein [Lentisphaeraceae bacterium]
PAMEQQNEVVNWINKKLKKIREEQIASKNGTPLRRLSHREYSNTIYDLFGFKDKKFLLASGLPKDSIAHSFDNNAHQLKVSAHLYENYLSVADKVLDRIILPRKKVQAQEYHIKPKDLGSGVDAVVYNQQEHGKSYVELLGAIPQRSRCWIEDGFAAPYDGEYKVVIDAAVINRNHPDWKFHHTPNPKSKFRLGLYSTSKEYGLISSINIADQHLKSFTIDDSKKKYEATVYLTKGSTLYLLWQNGINTPISIIIDKLARKKGFKKSEPTLRLGRWEAVERFYEGARVRIKDLKIEGPFFKEWPPEKTKNAFDGAIPDEITEEYLQSFLQKFAAKSWRRPVQKEEVAKIVSLAKQNLPENDMKALRIGMKAILVSPGFVYHYQNNNKLNDFGLASRLSYFLYGTAPDEKLMKLAREKQLSDPEKYSSLIKELILDPRTNRMIKDFTHQWLGFEKINVMKPDQKKFKGFYSTGAARYITHESTEFIKYLIKNNLSIYNCLDSDFVVVNPNLAKHYKLSGVKKNGFHAVKLPEDSIRGGLVTQASVLAATSNGFDTSPVIRGVFILENILGMPPPAPPSDVEPLEPDIRGAKSLVEQLKKHRENESCMTCHKKIDPMGLPLENLDVDGSFRKFYDKKEKLPVLPETVTSNGSEIKDIHDFKAYLMDNKQHFAKCLTAKIMSYATGREMTYLERGEIDEIALDLQKKDGFKDLLITILESNIFKSR